MSPPLVLSFLTLMVQSLSPASIQLSQSPVAVPLSSSESIHSSCIDYSLHVYLSLLAVSPFHHQFFDHSGVLSVMLPPYIVDVAGLYSLIPRYDWYAGRFSSSDKSLCVFPALARYTHRCVPPKRKGRTESWSDLFRQELGKRGGGEVNGT